MAVTGGTAFSYSEASDGGTVTSLVTLIGTTQVSVTSTSSLARTESLSRQVFTASATGSTTTSSTTAGSPATTA